MADIKAHCCGADLLFDEKTAKKQYKSYLKKGPSKVTKKLIEQLSLQNTEKTLLDIGGGIGALQWWFLNNSGESTIGVDASSGYIKLATEHALKSGFENQTNYILGDFTEVAPALPKVDILTLDKVICCYPNYKDILETASEKANIIALSYPMDGIVADAFRGLGVLYMKFKKNPFKPYIHRVSDVRLTMKNLGYQRVNHTLSFPWNVETYVKVENLD
jgi:magnesium-protoporphyrin O-methyltransferase